MYWAIYKDISQNLSELGLTVYCPPCNVEHTHVNFLELLTNPASIVKHHDITKMGHGKLLYSKCTSVCKLKNGPNFTDLLDAYFSLCAWFINMWFICSKIFPNIHISFWRKGI